MAPAVADRVWRASAPASVEADLSELWMDIGRKGPVARAMMSNLLVIRNFDARSEGEDRRSIAHDTLIDAVAARHPSRVVVIDHNPSVCDLSGGLAARVGIVTFGPPAARYGIEQVAVRSSCDEASLPSIVRRLARGNLPISVWWTNDFSTMPLIAPLVSLGRQLVFDSGGWSDVPGGFRTLEPWLDRDLVDVNWRRLGPMRRVLAFAARSYARNAWQPDRIRITHRPQQTALACLAAGWLASRLEYPAGAWPEVEEAANLDTNLSIAIGEGEQRIVATLDRSCAAVTYASGMPSIVGVPQEDDAEAIAAELHALSRDRCLQDTLRVLLRRFA